MLVVYLYDISVPCRLAAPIQILATARAIAAQGTPALVGFGRVSTPVEECLRFYGVTPHPCLTLRPFFTRGVWLWRLAARVADIIASHPAARAGPVILMSRGETGARLAPFIAHITQHSRRRGVALRFVYELHRLGHLHAADSGASLRQATRIRHAEASAIAAADGLVCLNRLLLEAVRAEHHVTCPTCLLPSGTDDDIDLGVPLEQRDLDVFYAGKFDERKGVRTLISALRGLPGRTLHLAGGTDDEQTRMRAFAAAEGVADRVTLLGYVEPASIASLYRRARVGACPLPLGGSAIAERFTSPMKVLQMMASGTPVVASDVPSVREVISHDETGWLVPPNDPAALADGLGLLLADVSRANRLRSAAADAVRQYTWSRRARTLVEFCASL